MAEPGRAISGDSDSDAGPIALPQTKRPLAFGLASKRTEETDAGSEETCPPCHQESRCGDLASIIKQELCNLSEKQEQILKILSELSMASGMMIPSAHSKSEVLQEAAAAPKIGADAHLPPSELSITESIYDDDQVSFECKPIERRMISGASSNDDHRTQAMRMTSAITSSKTAQSLGSDSDKLFLWQKIIVTHMLKKDWFDALTAFLILVHSTIIGVEIDLDASRSLNEERMDSFKAVHTSFAILFQLELFARMLGWGFVRFFTGPDYQWNVFDFVVVGSSVAELTVETFAASEDSSMVSLGPLRFVRTARIFRGLRLVRFITFIGPVRTILQCVANTGKSLVGTLGLLCLICYGFASAFTQLATDHCRSSKEALGLAYQSEKAWCNSTDFPELHKYWSSVPESMYTLFKSVAGGLSWHDATEPLRPVSAAAVALFLGYTAFVYFAVLNVITGVFCHSAIESANADKETAVMRQLSNANSYEKALKRVFTEMDEDRSRQITLDEFEVKMSDAHVSAYFRSMDIDTTDAWSFFKLIDQDRSGCVDVDEFVQGCLSLRGPAKAIHMAKMTVENKRTRTMIRSLAESLGQIERHVSALRKYSLNDDSLFQLPSVSKC